MAAELTTARLGRRERNKVDKVRRIREAARAQFVANGFDEASTRQIAVHACVALGTLFLYAANKRDLLFLVVNDELVAVASQAVAAVRPDASLMENLVAAFRPIYAFFSREPKLSRLTLREMMFYETGLQARRFVATRDRLIALCVKIVRMARQNKDIVGAADNHTIGGVIFAIFQIEIRKWLTGRRIDTAEGVAQLRRSFAIVIKGLVPVSRALQIRSGRNSRASKKSGKVHE